MKVSILTFSFLFTTFVGGAQPVNRIDEVLGRKLEQMRDDDVTQVIIVLADQVDVNHAADVDHDHP